MKVGDDETEGIPEGKVGGVDVPSPPAPTLAAGNDGTVTIGDVPDAGMPQLGTPQIAKTTSTFITPVTSEQELNPVRGMSGPLVDKDLGIVIKGHTWIHNHQTPPCLLPPTWIREDNIVTEHGSSVAGTFTNEVDDRSTST